MKLFIGIILMSTILLCEVSKINMSNNDICILDISIDGESEKETSENMEDFSNLKFMQNHIFQWNCDVAFKKELSFGWSISTSYLEIHSPPPELS